MRAHYQDHKRAILISISAWLVMVFLLFTLPISFCGYQSGEWDTSTWYFLSESGGVYGTAFLVALLCGTFAFMRQGWRKKVASFVSSFSLFALILGSLAYTNEYGLKPLMHQPWPSHSYLLQSPNENLTGFYSNAVEQRRAYLREFIRTNPDKVKTISPQVLNHWIAEAGYSFPSGHSQNVFLLSTILVFWLKRALPPTKHYWLVVPLTWAVLVCLSRVALGVHSEEDVVFGAAISLLLAYLFSLTGLLNRLFGFLPKQLD